MNTAELKELLANATPGPWKWDKELDRISGVFRASCEQNMEFLSWSEWIDVAPAGSCFEERKPVRKEANALLIALAPQLAADNIALQAEVERICIRARELVAYSERLEREAEMNAEDSEKLEAENAKLREALEEIASGDGVYGAQAHEYKTLARAALNETQGEPI